MDDEYDEDVYSLQVSLKRPNVAAVAITVAWDKEQPTNLIADAAYDLAKKAIEIGNQLANNFRED